MRYRTVELMARQDNGAAGTKIVDIDTNQIISRLKVIGRWTNHTTAVIADHPAANITKIELCDGSDVLYSASGFELQGMEFFDTGKPAYTAVNFLDSNVQATTMCLNFGHELYDPRLAFDPKRFNNPELKITWDEDVADTSATANTIEVWADTFEDNPPHPTGFCMVKEIKEYAQVAGANEYTDLPTDYPYKQLYVNALAKDYDFTDKIDEIELDVNTKERVPVNATGQYFERSTQQQYGLCQEKWYSGAETDTVQIYLMPTDSGTIYGSVRQLDDTFSGRHVVGNQYDICGEDDAAFKGMAMGNFPHGTCPLLQDNGPDKLDYITPKVNDHLKLRLKAGAASGTGNVQITARQIRSY